MLSDVDESMYFTIVYKCAANIQQILRKVNSMLYYTQEIMVFMEENNL